MNRYDRRKGTAISLLCHYLKQVYESAGMNWDDDNQQEVEQLIDAIVNEATKGLEDRIVALEKSLEELDSAKELAHTVALYTPSN